MAGLVVVLGGMFLHVITQCGCGLAGVLGKGTGIVDCNRSFGMVVSIDVNRVSLETLRNNSRIWPAMIELSSLVLEVRDFDGLDKLVSALKYLLALSHEEEGW